MSHAHSLGSQPQCEAFDFLSLQCLGVPVIVTTSASKWLRAIKVKPLQVGKPWKPLSCTCKADMCRC